MKCKCGKYDGERFKGFICDKCGSEVPYISFLAKLANYREVTKAKNVALRQLLEQNDQRHRQVVEKHFERVVPVWERFGYGVGRPPDGRTTKGKACQEECRDEDDLYFGGLSAMGRDYTANRKRIIEDYNEAVGRL